MKHDIRALELLERLFGNDLAISRVTLSNFPIIYSSGFDVYSASSTFSFIYIVPKTKEVPTDIINGMYQKCQNEYGRRTVVYIENPSNSKKKFFEAHHMNFVSSDGDYRLYEGKAVVPSFAIDENFPKENYTKITQLVANFYLSNNIGEYTVREIAESFDFSISSVSRANAFLHEINALEKTGLGTKAKYKLRSKKDFFERVKPYLINPVKRRKMFIISKNDMEALGGLICGETAFSYYAGLEIPNNFIEVALNKTEYEKCSFQETRLSEASNVCYVEEFIYNANYFAKGRIISPLDAYIIARRRYSGNDDPRIKDSLKKLERMIING